MIWLPVLMQDCEYLQATFLDKVVNAVRKPSHQYASYALFFHLVHLGILCGSINRGVDLENKLKA